MNKIRLLTVLVVLALGTAAWAPSSSVFRITLDTVSGGGSAASSASFAISSGIISNRDLRDLHSSLFVARQGFIPGVFEIILAPMVLSIEPDSGYNIAPITITKITGTNFEDGLTIQLEAEGQATLTAYNINLVSSIEVSCEFDLAGATEGVRDVVITNPDGKTGRLAGGFEIKSYPLPLGLAVNSPNPFDPARESTIIMYKLEREANVSAYLFSMTADMVWKRNFFRGQPGGQQGDNYITWDGITDFGEMASNSLYILHIVERDTGRRLARGRIAVLRRK